MTLIRAACIQMRSTTEIGPNLEAAEALIRDAASQGARLIATPEMTTLLDIRRGASNPAVKTEAEDPSIPVFQHLAKDTGTWLLIGSIAVRQDQDQRLANRSLLFSPEGNITARYDKINMFDVDVEDGQSYRESKAYRPGTDTVLAHTPLAKIGLTICYDVRFPQLHLTLAQAGAEILTCPAAFTKVTGQAHWHTLLRARAIETGCFVLAPAQGGRHEDGRETFGHSLILSPWGEVIAEADHDEPGLIVADLDLSEVAKARRKIPAWRQNPVFDLKISGAA